MLRQTEVLDFLPKKEDLSQIETIIDNMENVGRSHTDLESVGFSVTSVPKKAEVV